MRVKEGAECARRALRRAWPVTPEAPKTRAVSSGGAAAMVELKVATVSVVLFKGLGYGRVR